MIIKARAFPYPRRIFRMLCGKIVFLTTASVVWAAASLEASPSNSWTLDLHVGTSNDVDITWIMIPNDLGEPLLAILTEPQPRPKVNVVKDVKFLLYTRSNGASNPYTLIVNNKDNLKASGFNPAHPTKIMIHGFGGGAGSAIIASSKGPYLSKGNYNVIGVDWGALCKSPWYVTASENTVPVGRYIGELVQFLVRDGDANLKDIHIIGHSLGAHVAGLAGASVTIGNVGRVTGLDSALPLFGNKDESGRLDSSDAALVDTIHTCSDNLGFLDPHGHVDFYPHGGVCKQPGCGVDLLGSCSHSKAVEYFIHSITVEDAYPAVHCRTLSEARNGKCTGTSSGMMSDTISYGEYGLYYVSIS